MTVGIKPQFLVERQGRTFVLYAGLLDAAHQLALSSIETKLLQTPTPDNGQVAIVWAEVVCERGRFCGIGDASPVSVTKMIVPHTIRMAETRAKARALRDAINVGVTALEELGDDDPPEPEMVTGDQLAAIWDTGETNWQMDASAVTARCIEKFGLPPQRLSRAQATQFLAQLRQHPPKAANRDEPPASEADPTIVRKDPTAGQVRTYLELMARLGYPEERAIDYCRRKLGQPPQELDNVTLGETILTLRKRLAEKEQAVAAAKAAGTHEF